MYYRDALESYASGFILVKENDSHWNSNMQAYDANTNVYMYVVYENQGEEKKCTTTRPFSSHESVKAFLDVFLNDISG